MIIHPALIIALYALLQVPRCLSTLLNRSIDDFNGDTVTGQIPIFAPPDLWNIVVDSNCSSCFVKPVASETFDRTWHDTTARDNTIVYSVTLRFTGTAVYFFGIVPNTVPGTGTVINTAFSLDGTLAGSYTHNPDFSDEILYSVPMLSLEGLANIPHTLVAQAQVPSLLLFDYAVYTFDDGKNPASSTNNPGTNSPKSQAAPPPSTSNTTPSKTLLTSPGSSSSTSPGSQTLSALSTSSGDTGGTVSIMTVTISTAGQDQSIQSADVASQVVSSKSHFPVATVVGSVCGVVIVALLVCVLLWFRRRRYRAVPRVEAFNAATVGATPSHLDDTQGVSPYTSMRPEMKEFSPSESLYPSATATEAPGSSSGPPSPSGPIPPRALPSTPVRSLTFRTALPPYSARDPADNPSRSTAALLGEKSRTLDGA
ncbi:hypothetical protein R3P38DRAFT_3353741 [Favolaschia claudopus]|uniref:Uncharacterized protein n=1 Tax=Favolaschia claudopus TaxID=2862362 RepID=A0AAW0BU52_9AGAR